MKNYIYIIALFVMATFSSCESEVSFLELAESQGFAFTGSTQSIQELIGLDAYQKLTQDLGIIVNTGDTPPNINGNYPIWEVEIAADIADPGNVGTIVTDSFIHINLLNQNNDDLTIDYRGFFLEVGPDGAPLGGDDIFLFEEEIEGERYLSGNSTTGAFTIFGRVRVDANRVDVIAISGIRTATGVNNLEYGYVVYDTGNPDTGTIIGGQTYRDFDSVSDSFVWPFP